MSSLRTFSDADIQTLRGLIEQEERRRENNPSRPDQDRTYSENEDHQAPEVYVAYTPAAGIGAITGLIPGSAVCTVYQISRSGDTLSATARTKTVYNLSGSAISGNIYTPIFRDKYGKWVAVNTSGGAVRLGNIVGYATASAAATGSGTGTNCNTEEVIDGIYRVDVYKDDSLAALPEPCGYLTEYPYIEKFCCSIIDETSGDYIGCLGDSTDSTRSGSGSGSAALFGCVDSLGDNGGRVRGDLDESVYALDLRGRVLPVNTEVALTKVGEVWVILEAAIGSKKICFMTDIACGTDCDGNQVFLRTFTPVWIESWKICATETEFIPDCPGTGSGSGS